MSNKIPVEKEQAILDDYKRNHLIKHIAKKHGVSGETVRRVAKTYGIKRRDGRGKNTFRTMKKTQEYCMSEFDEFY